MLIGREAELEKLQSIANSLSDHRGATVLLHGEIGIGKTTLLHAYRDISGNKVDLIYSCCLDSVFSDELTPILDFARARSQEVAELLNRNVDVTDLFQALLAFFMSRQTPIVIIIEDAQWAGGMMLSFLRYFGRRLVFSRCMLVVSYRTSEVTSQHKLANILESIPDDLSHYIQLHPLSRDCLKLLSYSRKNLDKLVQITAGNPLFVAQLDFLTAPSFEKNVSVKDTIRSRIDILQDDERALLEVLSVIPYAIPMSLMRMLDESGYSLSPLIDQDRGFLVCDVAGCYRFQHELVRKTTLEQVSEIRQVGFHAKVLSSYAELDEPLNPVWELLHAHGASNAEKVIRLSQQLADTSAQISAHSEAAAYLSVALNYTYAADNETAAVLYESWAREASLAPEVLDKVIDFRQQAINLWKALGREDKVGENMHALSRSHWLNGNSAQAYILADHAIEILKGTASTEQVARAYSLRSQLSLLQSEHLESISLGNKALELEKLCNNNEIKAHALNNVGASMVLSGSDKGRELLQQSLDIALKHGLHEHISRAYVNYACCSLLTKDFAMAESLISKGIAYGTTHENESKSSYLSGLLSQVRAEQGKLADAEVISAGLLKSDEKTLIVLMPAQNVLARVRAITGADDAERKLNLALSKSLSIGEPQYVIAARLNLIEYAWIQNDQSLALKQIKKLVELEPSKLEKWHLAELNCWIARYNSEIKSEGAVDTPLPYQLELDGRYIDAAREWGKLGACLSQATCLMLDTSENKVKSLLEAHIIFERCAAHGLSKKLKQVAENLGLADVLPKRKRGKSIDSAQHPLGLTKKEQQLLEQILKGKSNIEISNALSRSVRTVETHVSSILAKFNVQNRLEIILRVQNEPWLTPSHHQHS